MLRRHYRAGQAINVVENQRCEEAALDPALMYLKSIISSGPQAIALPNHETPPQSESVAAARCGWTRAPVEEATFSASLTPSEYRHLGLL